MKKLFSTRGILGLSLAFISILSVYYFTKNQFFEKTSLIKKEQPKTIQKENSLAKQPKKAQNKSDNKKTIYLTFDDGPNKGTENVIKIVKQEKVPVTVFVIGEHTIGSKAQIKSFDILKSDPLFEIANHGYSHAWNNQFSKFYKNPDAVINDFNKSRKLLNLTSYTARTPGRNIWRINNLKFTDIKTSAEAADKLALENHQLIGWDLEWKEKDTKHLNSSKMIQNRIDSVFKYNLTKTENHLVLLMHDQYFCDSASIKELGNLVASLKNNKNYKLKHIKDYPSVRDLLP